MRRQRLPRRGAENLPERVMMASNMGRCGREALTAESTEDRIAPTAIEVEEEALEAGRQREILSRVLMRHQASGRGGVTG